MFSIDHNKCPGLDGLNSLFFINAWSLVGQLVTQSIQYNFKSGIHKSIKSSLLYLIPKTSNPITVKNFRPISCSNTLFKTFSKILVSHLKLTMPYIISPNQSTFIQGRQVQDNLSLAHEVLRGYNRNLDAL